MAIAYFDCFEGADGDMLLGALVHAGLAPAALHHALSGLDLGAFAIDTIPVSGKGVGAIQVTTRVNSDPAASVHPTIDDMAALIARSHLDNTVKEQSLAVFTRLAEAAAQTQGPSVQDAVLHAAGTPAAVLSIVGVVAGLHLMGIDQVFCSPLQVGTGTVTSAQGTFPVPTPVTAALLQQRAVPVFATGVRGELTTAVGAALLTTLAGGFGPMPSMVLGSVGYGAGPPHQGHGALLRVIIGDSHAPQDGFQVEPIAVLETNVDDLSPQVYDYLMERAFGEGAYDVFCVPVQMKKSRCGTLVTITCPPDAVPRFCELLIAETSTIGVRWRIETRYKTRREFKQVKTPYGPISVKYALYKGAVVNASPEYEDCKKAARRHRVPLKKVMASASAVIQRAADGTAA